MDLRQSKAMLKLSNLEIEWVTSIVAINASGWALPAQIIFAATKHQSLWYHELPEDYTISVSKNGWTTDELGVE